MSRKKTALLIALVSLGIIVGYFLAANYYRGQSNPQGTTQPPQTPEQPNHPPLVVPENPIGTIGIMATLIAALSIFALKKKPIIRTTK